MLGRLALVLSFIFCIESTMAEERPEVGRYLKAFSGDLGVTVWMTRIGPPEKREVIIQVEGVDHPWNKVIIKHRMEYWNGRETYVAALPDGSEFQTFLLTETTGQLFLPDERRAMRVSYDRALAALGNPEHFLTDYLKQEAEKTAFKTDASVEKNNK